MDTIYSFRYITEFGGGLVWGGLEIMWFAEVILRNTLEQRGGEKWGFSTNKIVTKGRGYLEESGGPFENCDDNQEREGGKVVS